MLGRAMADKAIQEGDEAVQRGIERLFAQRGALTAREDETLFCYSTTLRLKACAEELTKRGVDGESIKDKDFIAFAEMMRSDVPLLKVYEQYARTWGHKAAGLHRLGTGQGPAGAPYFSQEQVRHMTRKKQEHTTTKSKEPPLLEIAAGTEQRRESIMAYTKFIPELWGGEDPAKTKRCWCWQSFATASGKAN